MLHLAIRPRRVLLLALCLLGPSLLACRAAESKESGDPPAVTLAGPDLGGPLVVNGEEISLDEVRRYTLLVSPAYDAYELAKIQVFLDREIRRQIEEEGKTAEDFTVSPPVSDDAPADPIRAAQVAQTAQFQKVFLPENPYEYPPLTVAALTGDEEFDVLQAVRDEWVEKQEQPAEEAAADSDDSGERLFQRMLTQRILRHLNEAFDIRELEDGIDVDLVGIVDGVEITVAEIWERAADRIEPEHVRTAKQWLVSTTLLRQAMTETGYLMSREEARALWVEQAAPYRDSLFSLEKLALAIKKFPTIGMWLEYHRLYESLRLQVTEEMTSEALARQADERTSAIVSLATVDVDIILLSVYDFEKQAWKENGWEEAAARAQEVTERLAAGDAWGVLLDEYSDFHDPPVPEDLRGSPQAERSLKRKGRFRDQNRNNLSRLLEEPEFYVFLHGGCVTDAVFFAQEVGTIGDPLAGPHGYYIPRLLHRSLPTVVLSPDDSKARVYLEQDYLNKRIVEYTRELLARSTVSGL